MGIVDQVSETIRTTMGDDILNLLRLYEQTFPPDWGLTLVEGGPSLMDFSVVGGDIQVVGFWYNATLDSVIALAVQDLLLRLLINDTHSRFISDFGVGPIEDLPRDTIKAAVALAAANSPYLAEVGEIVLIDGEVDELDIRISATTVTGDKISFPLSIGGSS